MILESLIPTSNCRFRESTHSVAEATVAAAGVFHAIAKAEVLALGHEPVVGKAVWLAG